MKNHPLRNEWEKLFGKKHDWQEAKNTSADSEGSFHSASGEKATIWGKDNVDDVNEMMTRDWDSFLDGSDVFSNLEAHEQEELRQHGPGYDEYRGD